MSKLLSMLLLLVAGTACIPPRWHRVQPGMNKTDVLHFVGEPTRRTYDDDLTKGKQETWYFDSFDPHDHHFDPHWVRFIDERVTASGYDKPRFFEYQRQQSELVSTKKQRVVMPSDLGFACADASQCQSKQCINHRCAGPDGCTHARGDSCLSDLDCCSKHCIMSAMECS